MSDRPPRCHRCSKNLTYVQHNRIDEQLFCDGPCTTNYQVEQATKQGPGVLFDYVMESVREGKMNKEQATHALKFPTLDDVAVKAALESIKTPSLPNAVTDVVAALGPLNDEQRWRVLRATAILLGLKGGIAP